MAAGTAKKTAIRRSWRTRLVRPPSFPAGCCRDAIAGDAPGLLAVGTRGITFSFSMVIVSHPEPAELRDTDPFLFQIILRMVESKLPRSWLIPAWTEPS